MSFLGLAGAAAVTAAGEAFLGHPTTAFTDLLPTVVGDLTLLVRDHSNPAGPIAFVVATASRRGTSGHR